jgi:hypothetical protein
MNFKFLAGAAAVTALIATPAMAQTTQQQFSGPQQHAADSTGAKKVKKMHQARVGDSRASYREEPRSGVGPADVAAGVVGGAVGTAGAIATAPFAPSRGDSYAHYRDTSTMPNRGYIADSRATFREEPRSGFWPADVAAGVVGGAIGTAGAIATAPFTPFRGDSYAYYRDTSTMPNRGYIADANGPVCLPGSVITLNGQRMLCQ